MSANEEEVPLQTSQPCQIHGKHMPNSHINHRHHVWPLADGGPNTADNIVVVCPTGHANIHDLIKQYKVMRGVVPNAVRKRYTFKERALAKLGYERITRKAM